MLVGLDRVEHAETWEAGKVAVGAAQLQSVLDGDRGQVGVRNQVSCGLHRSDQLAQDLGVALGRAGDPDVGERGPLEDLAPRETRGERLRKEAWVRGDPEKGDEGGPGEADSA